MMRMAILVAGTALAAGCVNDGGTDYDKAEAEADADAGKEDGFDVCELAGWYGDGVCDRFCDHFDSDCPLLGPEPVGAATRYPILLHHGLGGGRSWIVSWYGIAEALRADGNVVTQSQVPPFDSVEVRGRALATIVDDVLRTTGAAKVNLIAHAQGGLDARYLISTLGYGDRVASLTTISSPHHGAYLADFILDVGGDDVNMLNAFARVIGASINDVESDAHLRAALASISEANSPAFNAANPDVAGVYYQSWAGVATVSGRVSSSQLAAVRTACDGKIDMIVPGTFDKIRLEYALFDLIIGAEPHDGMEGVASSRWGDWKGCIPADHADELGRMTTSRPNPRTGFDPERFWRQVVGDLAARGF